MILKRTVGLVLCTLVLGCPLGFGQGSKVELATDVKGVLPPANGGRCIATVGLLSSMCGTTTATFATVTDGFAASDCTAGTGSSVVPCMYNGSAWVYAGGSGVGGDGGTFAGLTPGANTATAPWSIAPGSALGGSTANFSILGATGETNTGFVVNIDTPAGSFQPIFRVGNIGVDAFKIIDIPGANQQIISGFCSTAPATSSDVARFIHCETASNVTGFRELSLAATALGVGIQSETTAPLGTGRRLFSGRAGVANDGSLGSGAEVFSVQDTGTLNLGTVGAGATLSGAGATSGTATVIWPAIAGTITNPFTFSNAISSASNGSFGGTLAVTGLATLSAGLTVSSGAITLPITGASSQCLHVSSAGVLSGTGIDCGPARYSLTPATDGTTVAFTAPLTVSANALVVRNGLIRIPGSGKDYTVSGTTITFAVAPLSSDTVLLYQ